MTKVFLMLFAVTLQGATILQINCGSATDNGFTGGTKYTSVNQPDLSLQSAPYNALRYGATVTYVVAVPTGPIKVTLGWLEPRTASSTPPISAGQRIMMVTLNGIAVLNNLDLFAVAGSQKPYEQSFNVNSTSTQLMVSVSGVPGKLTAVLSMIRIEATITPPVGDGVAIKCESGSLKAGVDLTADASYQETVIMSNLPGETRWEQVTICATERFLGQTKVTASMGRPGTNNIEMTGVEVPMENSSGNYNCWTARPAVPQFIGPYDIALNVKVYTAVDGALLPGKINMLTTGSLTWEACRYPGKIGNLDIAGKLIERFKVLQCSGSGAGIDPQTGAKTSWNCDGLIWAKYLRSDGSLLSFVGAPTPAVGTPAVLTTWTPVQ